MDKRDKIYIAGHLGMVGSAIVRVLRRNGFTNLTMRTRAELDLRDQHRVREFFAAERPDIVVLAAAKVGGIRHNLLHKAEFLLENLEIQNNVIYQACKHQVKKFCFLGSSCIYPCDAPQPLREEYLLRGPFEPTNEGYALAKVAGYKLGCYLAEQYGFDIISLMPCNLYGTNDNYDPEHSHVFPALIRKFADAADFGAEEVTLWGTGIARREFLHADDLSRAVLFLLEHWNSPEFINVGAGRDVSIRELATLIAAEAGFVGRINWDDSQPDGMLLKRLDVTKLEKTGFKPEISLRDGIGRTLAEYRALREHYRKV